MTGKKLGNNQVFNYELPENLKNNEVLNQKKTTFTI